MTMVKTINFNDKSFEVSYVLQPIISRGGELSFFEILGRVKDKNDGVIAVHPQIAAKYTKMLIEYAYNLTAMNYFPNSKLSLNISHTEINADIVNTLLQLFSKRELANRVMIDVVQGIGADYLQGFYLGKPHSIEYYKGKEKVFGKLHYSFNLAQNYFINSSNLA